MPGPERAVRVAVLGASGYAGGEVLRLLLGHPRVESVRACSRSHAGRPVGSVHPSLAHVTPASFEPADPTVASAADTVFLALPHGESQEVMGAVLAAGPRLVVDLGADFRIGDLRLYETHYGTHRRRDLAGSFVYGLADVEPECLRGASRIAAPGCFATAALLALRPLASAGIDGAPVCFAVTGSSGSGASPKRTTHHPVRAHNLFAYALAGHRHEAEVLDRLRSWTRDPLASARLVTHSGPFVRGIHATLHARLVRPLEDPLALLARTYEGRPFVRVLPEPPELSAVTGTNWAHLHASPRDGGREVLVTVALDNLVKGAAGQAVQSMNLALGFDETEGLEFPGIYPC